MEAIFHKETIPFDSLYGACIKRNWFSSGSNTQYEKMFDANRHGATVHELAIMIWLCSDVQFLEDIEDALWATVARKEVAEDEHDL